MKIGIAADHGGFALKEILRPYLTKVGYEVTDFGNTQQDDSDDYPDFVGPLAKAIVAGDVERGIAICGSGVGASVAANKIRGVRAALINDSFSAHQGVEDDDLNLLCLGGRITGYMVAQEYVLAFLNAQYTGLKRHARRLNKVAQFTNI